MERALYSPKEVAELLGVNENTLYKWRAAGEGPPFLRLSDGGRVRYERESLRAWVACRLSKPTGLLVESCRGSISLSLRTSPSQS